MNIKTPFSDNQKKKEIGKNVKKSDMKSRKTDKIDMNDMGKNKIIKKMQNTKNGEKRENLHIEKNKKSKSTPMIWNMNDMNDMNDMSKHIKHITYHQLNTVFSGETYELIISALFNKKKLSYDGISKVTKIDRMYIPVIMNRDNHKDYFESIGRKDGVKIFQLTKKAEDYIFQRLKEYSSKQQSIIQRDLERKVVSKSREDFILECKEYMSLNKKDIGKAVRVGDNVLYIDFKKLSKHSPQLTEALMSEPEEIIQALEIALDETELMKKARVRLKNIPKLCSFAIEEIRGVQLNKLISVEGRVTSITNIRPHVINAKFECPSCGTVISVLQIEKKFREPSRCSCGRRGQFRLLSKEMIDAAGIVLEDLQEKTDNPHAQRLKAVLKSDLVNKKNIKKFMPGNEIKCIGILKEVPIVLRTGAISTKFDHVLEIISAEELQTEINVDNFSIEEVDKIKELAKAIDEKGLNEINSSFAPHIEGYSEIKNALILQCACPKNNLSEDSIRSKPNIFLIGDTGIAKSELGDFAVAVTPHSRKAIGGSSSAVGITASVIKEEDGYRIEPGAFVLAKELLLLDELNNLNDEDKPKLQEAMEQQKITINKANLHLSLKVTSGMLATANPEGGNFNIEKDITSQFNVPIPILNRFDIIFAMRDKPKAEKDRLVARKVINRERGKIESKYGKEFLKKFFAYVRNIGKPEIDDKLQEKLEEIYVKLRKSGTNNLVINARFLVSLQRLIKASARLRLSKVIEEKDIERSMNILSKSHFQINQYSHYNFTENKNNGPKESTQVPETQQKNL